MKKIFFLLVFIMGISGCTAIGVPITSNPNNKLDYAINLLKIDRPLPAESLIQEAVHIYKKQGDELGLANAYRIYALFLQSKAVENWGTGYRQRGFMDGTVNFDGRNKKAIEYFEMAKIIYERYSSYDGLTNIYFNIGKVYYFKFNDKIRACKSFSESYGYYLKFRKNNPTNEIEFPAKFSSYKNYILAVKNEAGCNGSSGDTILN